MLARSLCVQKEVLSHFKLTRAPSHSFLCQRLPASSPLFLIIVSFLRVMYSLHLGPLSQLSSPHIHPFHLICCQSQIYKLVPFLRCCNQGELKQGEAKFNLIWRFSKKKIAHLIWMVGQKCKDTAALLWESICDVRICKISAKGGVCSFPASSPNTLQAKVKSQTHPTSHHPILHIPWSKFCIFLQKPSSSLI